MKYPIGKKVKWQNRPVLDADAVIIHDLPTLEKGLLRAMGVEIVAEQETTITIDSESVETADVLGYRPVKQSDGSWQIALASMEEEE